MNPWSAHLSLASGGFSLEVEITSTGGILALIGPNGSGKTSLLRALIGGEALDQARVVIGERVLEDTRAGIRLPIEAREIGYVPQGFGLFPNMSVLENVAFGLSVGSAPMSRSEREGRAVAMLEEVGCMPLANRRVMALSGGERQRVALARALVTKPSLLLLDEPLAALDPTTRHSVRGFLKEQLTSLEVPVVLVTHDARDVVSLADDVCVLEEGRITRFGTLDEVMACPESLFVEAFFEERE